MISIKLNGKNEKILPSTVYHFVMKKGLNMGSLLIEYNGEILKKEKWQSVQIKDNDEIELLNFVGGG